MKKMAAQVNFYMYPYRLLIANIYSFAALRHYSSCSHSFSWAWNSTPGSVLKQLFEEPEPLERERAPRVSGASAHIPHEESYKAQY